MRVGKAMDVRDLINPFKLVKEVEVERISLGGGGKEEGNNLVKIAELEAEVLKLRQQLGKAVGLNDTLWKKMVEGSMKNGEAMEGVEAQR